MSKNWTTTWTSRFYGMLVLTAAMALAPVCASTENAVAPATATHILGTSSNLLLVLEPYDGTFSALTSDGTVAELTNGVHYTLSGTTNFSILASFLNAQTVSDVTLTFNMTNGVNPTSVVTIAAGNATTTPTVSYAMASTNTASITVTPNGRSVTNLFDGTVSLVQNTDYSVSGNIYTILNAYLITKSVGTIPMTFQMDGGNNPTTTVSVVAGNAAVSPTSGSHTLGTTNTLAFDVTRNGRSVTNLRYGVTSLTTNHYTLASTSLTNTYVILDTFLNGRTVGTTNLTFQMNGGSNPSAAVTINAGDATVSPTTASHSLGSTNNIPITVTRNGRTVTNIFDGTSSLVSNTHYTVSGSVYSIRPAYLNAQSAGDIDLTFQMSGGNSPTTTVTVADGDATVSPTAPGFTLGSTNALTITLSTNGRTFNSLVHGVTELAADTDYTYTASNSTFRILPIYLNAFQAATNVPLTFQMDAGSNPTSTVALAAGNATIAMPVSTYNLGTATNIAITLTRNGRTLTAIRQGTNTLAETTDYTVSSNVYTIKSSYLSTKSPGSLALTFDMNAGTDPDATITISQGDASVTPGTATHTLGSLTNLVFTLTLNGRTFSSLTTTNGVGSPLASPLNYTISGGNVITVNSSYLNNQTGNFNLTFNMNGGAPASAAITVNAGTDSVSPVTAAHTLGSASDLFVTYRPNGRTLASIKNGVAVLTNNVHYTQSGNLYAVKATYLNTLTAGTNTFTFDSNGSDPSIAVTITAGNASITPASATYQRTSLTDLPITLTLNGRELTNIVNSTTSSNLVENTDYVVNGSVYTITNTYLEARLAGTNTLTFQMNGGQNPAVAVDVEPSVSAELLSILGETDGNPNGGNGATPEQAIAWDVDVANNVDALTLGDIDVSQYANASLYTNASYAVTNQVFTNTVNLSVGGNTVYVKVRAEDSAITNYYRVVAWRAASAEAELVSIMGTNVVVATGDGTFATNAVSAKLDFPEPTNALYRSQIVVSDNATFRIYTTNSFSSYDEIIPQSGDSIALSHGLTDYYIKVIAENTAAVKYYKVPVERDGSAVAALTNVLGQATPSGLAGAGSLGTPYLVTNTVLFATDVLRLVDIQEDDEVATAELYTNVGFTDNKDQNILLGVGTNKAYIKVVSQNRAEEEHYDVTIVRSAASSTATIATVLGESLDNIGSEDGTNAATRITSSINVLYAVTNLTQASILPTDSTATITLYSNNGFSANENASIALTQDGATEAYILVTPESGPADSRYYQVTVTNGAPNNTATLTSVLEATGSNPTVVAGGDGLTDTNQITWAFNVPFAVATVGPADVEVFSLATSALFTDDDYSSGPVTVTPMSLTAGVTNSLYIKVLAEANAATNFYEALIFRGLAEQNAGLASVLGETDLAPNTSPGLHDGTATNKPILWAIDVPFTTNAVGLADIILSSGLANASNLYSDASFTTAITGTNTISLPAGQTTPAYIKVTSEDVTFIRYYRVNITRDGGDTKAALIGIYDDTVAYPPSAGVGSFAQPYLLTNSVTNEVAAIGLDNLVVTNTASGKRLFSQAFLVESEVTGTNTIALSVNPTNTVYVWVTAQNVASNEFYAVTIIRAPNADATLDHVLNLEDTTPAGGVGTNSATAIAWSINVPYTTTSVGTNDLMATKAEANALLYSDSNFSVAVSGTNRIAIGFEPVTAYVKVTAEDNATVRYYAVEINRRGGLQVSPLTLSYNAIPGYNPLAAQLTQTVVVSNSYAGGPITVGYTTEVSANSGTNAWFSFDQAGPFTDIEPDAKVTLTGVVNVGSLAAGTYYATNTFTDAANMPWLVVVTLHVAAAAENVISFTDLEQAYTGDPLFVGVSAMSGTTNINIAYTLAGEPVEEPVNVGTYQISATVSADGVWLTSSNSAAFSIIKATQVINFTNTTAVYDGDVKPVTATTLFGTNEIVLTYNGALEGPVTSGVYTVVGTVDGTDNWEAGSGTTNLTIERASQSVVSFLLPISARLDETIEMTAVIAPTQSDDTPTFSIISGPGAITNGNYLTFTGGGTVVVSASSAGTGNYNPASALQASIFVVDFSDAAIEGSFRATHTGVHTLQFDPDGNLHMFYSSDAGGMNVSVAPAGTNAFGEGQLIGSNSSNLLLRSRMDAQFGETTTFVGQSGTWGLIANATNATLASFTNSAAAALRNSRFVAGTAPTNHLFVNRGSSRVIALSTTNNWTTTESSNDIGAGVLSGAHAVGDTLAVFTSSGILISTNAGATYASLAVQAGSMARGGERAWYAANLRTVNQTYAIEVSVNVKALEEMAWRTGWSSVNTFELGADIASHIRVAAYENIAIISWQQGSDGRLMYTVTQDHGATWTEPVELISVPSYVRQSTAEAGYDIAVHEKDEQVRFVLAAGLDFSGIDLTALTLRATALQTNVYLRWDQPTLLGAPSDEVLIRFQTGTNYPTLTSGNTLYQGTEQLYVHEPIVQYQTYLYQLWVRSGGSFVDPTSFSGSKDINMYEWRYASPSATVSPATANYAIPVGGNVAFTVAGNGRSVTNITTTGTVSPLVENTDYTVSGNVYTLLADFLAAQTAGTTVTVTFEMDGGSDPEVAISIFNNATVDTPTASFNLFSSADLDIELTPNGWSLTDIVNGMYTLVEDTDYTVSGNTYSILASYLNTQEIGDITLTFQMSGGVNPTSVVTIANNALVSPTKYRHTLGSSTTLPITLTSGGRSLTNITDGASLSLTTDYTVSSNVYTILPAYLNDLSLGDNTLTFQMNGGVNPTTLVKVSVGDAELENSITNRTLGTMGTVSFVLIPQERVFNALTDGNKVLIKDTHFTVSGDTYTLLASYLNTLEPGVTELTFNMNAGVDPVGELFVSPGTPVMSPDSQTRTLGAGTALAVTLTRNGRTLSGIKNGSATLVPGVDYTVVVTNTLAPVYTVSTNYLNTLPVGASTLTFDMTFGTDPNVTITVQAGTATVTPTSVDHARTDVSGKAFTLTRNGRSLASITNTTTSSTLISGIHFSADNSNPLRPVYTIFKTYLDSLGDGPDVLQFNMDGGSHPTATVTISAE